MFYDEGATEPRVPSIPVSFRENNSSEQFIIYALAAGIEKVAPNSNFMRRR